MIQPTRKSGFPVNISSRDLERHGEKKQIKQAFYFGGGDEYKDP
jgi:hypothetical protein